MEKMQELENSTARVSTGVLVVFGDVFGCRREELDFDLCIFFSTGCRETRGGKLHVERKHSNPRGIDYRKLQGFCWYRLLRVLFLTKTVAKKIRFNLNKIILFHQNMKELEDENALLREEIESLGSSRVSLHFLSWS